MKKMICALPLVVIALTGCDPIEGQLTVKKAFQVAVDMSVPCNPDRDPSCNPDKEDHAVISKGGHQAKFEMSSEESAQITVTEADGSEVSFNLTIPAGKSLPQRDGNFSLKSSEIGQSFDAKGSLHTDVADSAEVHTVESCTRTEQEQFCRDGQCHTVTRTINGQQEVSYYTEDTTTHLIISLLQAKTVNEYATFQGDRYSSRRIYTYQGICD